MRIARVWLVGVLLCLGSLPGVAEEKPAETPANELEALRAQLAAQQQQIQQLQEMLRQQLTILAELQRRLGPGTATPRPPNTSGSADATQEAALEGGAPLEERVEKLEQVVASEKKENLDRWKRLGPFRFSGDIRVRYEPFFQAGTEQRHRERMRLRFQANAELTKELSGGFRIATGGLDDPISTNQSFTNFFTRKSFDLDRAWLTYKPERLGWLTLTGGKFAYPWYRTELIFDNDLNPEGFAETFSFKFEDKPLRRFTVVAFQLPFNELSNGKDSFLWGGQVQTEWRLSERARLGLYAAGMDLQRADPIAVAIGLLGIRPSLPLTNRVVRNPNGVITGFAEKFAYLDLIAELDYNWRPRWPLRLTLDFVNNLRASEERSGYWAEIEVGKTSEAGDWAFGYTFLRVEREAVIGAYNYSDTRASTNLLQHRLRAAYQIHRNVTVENTFFFGRLFNPQDSLSLVPPAFQPLNQDPYLKRLQFDVIYKF